MSELLNAWMIEVVVILTVLMPLGLIAAALSDLKADKRRRERGPDVTN
jgi:hypothetical protein